MSSNTVRTVVIFGIIALVLGAAAVGGIRLMKARNASYASSQSQKTAATDTTKQQPAAKKDESKSTSSPTSSTDKNKTSTTQQTPAAAPTPAASTPPPVTTDTTKSTAASNALPATSGLSPSDFMATFVLMLAAAFFGSKLLKARADYRRYLRLQ